MKQNYTAIIRSSIFITCLIILFVIHNLEVKKVNSRLDSFLFAVGEIIETEIPDSLLSLATSEDSVPQTLLHFIFNFDSLQVKASQQACGNDFQKLVEPGDKYLVVFSRENPEKSLVLLDYPVRDSSDFTRYQSMRQRILHQRLFQ
jgi:hypothetical protein